MRNLVTPIGTIVFGSIIEARENPNSGKVEWNLGLVLSNEDSETILEAIEQALAAKRTADPRFPATNEKLKFPYRMSEKKNEEGVKEPDPDNMLWSFKRNSTYKTKTGEQAKQAPPSLYDSLGRVVTGTIERIPPRSTGKVVYDIYVYDMPAMKGVSLQVKGFQVAELRQDEAQLAPIEGGWVADESELDSITAALAGDA